MKTFQAGLLYVGGRLHPLTIIFLLIALNIFWTATLDAFGNQFERVSGRLPLDLQNVSGALTADAAQEQIWAYSNEARSLYWSFFILDNFLPVVVFGAISLLWVKIFRRLGTNFFLNILNSPFLLLPWGVGLFDIAENLCFIVAINAEPQANTLTILNIGLIFVRLKAACIIGSFTTTAALLVILLIAELRRLVNR